MPMSVAAIILAAGASRRLGQPKQLSGFRGETLLERALRIAREAGASPVLAVLGAHFAPICATIPFNDAIPVFNDKWEEGMSSSIHAGLHEARRPRARCCGRAGDDLRSAASYRRTSARVACRRLPTQPTPSIVASSYAGVHGIPAVFPRSVFPDLLALRGDKGARSLLVKPPCPVIAVAVRGWRNRHRPSRRSGATGIALSARSWPRCSRAARRWAQRCDWDCPARTGSDRRADGAGWAW